MSGVTCNKAAVIVPQFMLSIEWVGGLGSPALVYMGKGVHPAHQRHRAGP